MREGWPNKRIGDLCDVFTGGTPSKTKPEYFESGDIPWLVSGDIHKGEITECDGRITELGLRNSNAKYLPVDSVLIALNGQGKTRATVALLRMRATCNQSLVCMSPKDSSQLLPEYLYANLHGRYEELRKLTGDSGNDRRGLNMAMIKALQIPVAPLSEQKRIVAILDEAFAGIATAIANTEKNLANARELFESYLHAVIDAAFSNGKIAVLADLASEITDGDHMPPPKAPSGIPFVTIKNIDKKTRKIDFEDTFSVPRDYFERLKENKRPQEGDVLYTVTGSFGIPVLVEQKSEFCFQRHIGLIRPKPDTNSKWLYYLLLSPQLFAQAIERATGTAQKTVSLKALRGFKVPVVQWNRQLAAVQGLDELYYEAERLESIYRQKLNALAELRQSLLQKAFSGELTTAPQDEIETALA